MRLFLFLSIFCLSSAVVAKTAKGNDVGKIIADFFKGPTKTPQEYVDFLEKYKDDTAVLREATRKVHEVLNQKISCFHSDCTRNPDYSFLAVQLKQFEIEANHNFFLDSAEELTPDDRLPENVIGTISHLYSDAVYQDLDKHLADIYKALEGKKYASQMIEVFNCSALVNAYYISKTLRYAERTESYLNFQKEQLKFSKQKLNSFLKIASRNGLTSNSKCELHTGQGYVTVTPEGILSELEVDGHFTKDEIDSFRQDIDINYTAQKFGSTVVCFPNGTMENLVGLNTKGICDISAAVKMIVDNTKDLKDKTEAINNLSSKLNNRDCGIATVTRNFRTAEANYAIRKKIDLVVRYEILPGSQKYIEIMYNNFDLEELEKELQKGQ